MKPSILVPYDFSAAADLALSWAANQHRLAGGSLHVVCVAKPRTPSTMAMPPAGGGSADEIEALRLELKTLLQDRHVDATHEVLLSPSPSAAVLEASIARKSSLIVMGTHGRGGLERLALGSVADHLVRHAECPVVTMRAP